MKQTKAVNTTPSPRRNQTKGVDKGKSPSAEFISLALDMSWKLAVVVLLPIIAGSILSNRYNTSYYLIGGIVIAFIMAIVVIYQSYVLANDQSSSVKKGSK